MGYTAEQYQLAGLFAAGTITPFVGAGLWWSAYPGPGAAQVLSAPNDGRQAERRDVGRQAADFLGLLCPHVVPPEADTARKVSPGKGAFQCLLLRAALRPPILYATGNDTSVAEAYQFLERIYRRVDTPWDRIKALRLDGEYGSRERWLTAAFVGADAGEHASDFESPAAWISRSSAFWHSPLLIGVDFRESDTKEMFTRLCCRADRVRWGAETYIVMPRPVPGAYETLHSFGIHPIYLNTYPGANNVERLAFFREGILELAVTISDRV